MGKLGESEWTRINSTSLTQHNLGLYCLFVSHCMDVCGPRASEKETKGFCINNPGFLWIPRDIFQWEWTCRGHKKPNDFIVTTDQVREYFTVSKNVGVTFCFTFAFDNVQQSLPQDK